MTIALHCTKGQNILGGWNRQKKYSGDGGGCLKRGGEGGPETIMCVRGGARKKIRELGW